MVFGYKHLMLRSFQVVLFSLEYLNNDLKLTIVSLILGPS